MFESDFLDFCKINSFHVRPKSQTVIIILSKCKLIILESFLWYTTACAGVLEYCYKIFFYKKLHWIKQESGGLNCPDKLPLENFQFNQKFYILHTTRTDFSTPLGRKKLHCDCTSCRLFSLSWLTGLVRLSYKLNLALRHHLRPWLAMVVQSMVLPWSSLGPWHFFVLVVAGSAVVTDGIIFLGTARLAFQILLFSGNKGFKIQPSVYRNHSGPHFLENFNPLNLAVFLSFLPI